MNALHPAFAEAIAPLHAETFTAWRIPTGDGPDCKQAYPLDTGDAATPEEALAAALVHYVDHKDHVAVLQSHAGRGRNTLRLYAIKREAKRTWRRNPVTGASEPSRRLYPVLLIAIPVAAFDPAEPFCVTAGTTVAEIVGLDAQLVEGR